MVTSQFLKHTYIPYNFIIGGPIFSMNMYYEEYDVYVNIKLLATLHRKKPFDILQVRSDDDINDINHDPTSNTDQTVAPLNWSLT